MATGGWQLVVVMTDDLWPTGSWIDGGTKTGKHRKSRSARCSIEDLKGEVWSQKKFLCASSFVDDGKWKMLPSVAQKLENRENFHPNKWNFKRW